MKMKTTTKKKKATATRRWMGFGGARGMKTEDRESRASTNLPHSELSLHLASVLCFGPNDNDTMTLG